jgi:hypothetical protein
MILSLGPLLLAVTLAFGGLKIQQLAAPRALVPVNLALYLITGCIVMLHNSALFPHRVQGALFDQTARIHSPPALAGLRVHPASAAVMEWTRDALRKAGFKADKDRLLAAYNLPGLVAAADARAFGSADFVDGYVDIETWHCRLVELDTTDLHQLGRLFLLTNAPISTKLSECLRERGADPIQAQPVDIFSTGYGPKLTLSLITIPPVSVSPR